MSKEELINQAKENAKQNFKEGLNCAESVLQAVIDTGLIKDFPPEVVAVSTGFGGGIGQYGAICGALAGATIAVSCVHGRKNPMEGTFEERVAVLQGNPGLYRLFNNLPNDFMEKFGECECEKLTNDYKGNFGAKERKKLCQQYVIEGAGIAAEYIIKGNEEDGFSNKMRKNVPGKE
jgi:C_GCAxxG_C_C family probable redox protein